MNQHITNAARLLLAAPIAPAPAPVGLVVVVVMGVAAGCQPLLYTDPAAAATHQGQMIHPAT
jgi:hypothetical protein